MIKLCKHNQDNVIAKLKNGELDTATLSTTNIVDDIIVDMYDNDIFSCLSENIPDMRHKNTIVPYDVIWASAIAAKMRVHTSLTDIPYALNDHKTLAKLGYMLLDDEGKLTSGLMREGSLRHLLGKYDSKIFIDGYNNTVQKGILPMLDMSSDIHILDCTDLEVCYDNKNYEQSGVAHSKRDDELTRGYKLAALRGIVDDNGVIEEIEFGSLNTHDLNLCTDMLKNTKVFKQGDILINDRGFISRELINYLKTQRGVDTYVPIKKNMATYKQAVIAAELQDDWQKHPNKNRKDQVITFVPQLGPFWVGENTKEKEDVPVNGCVVWDKADDEYFVFVTTDTTKSAREILQIYELRPEIEEDFRQLKDFWQLEDFKSTKLNVILFHIVCVLFGYLFYQLYTLSPQGADYLGKILSVALKRYMPKVQSYAILHTGDEFAILGIFELMNLYANADEKIRGKLSDVLREI